LFCFLSWQQSFEEYLDIVLNTFLIIIFMIFTQARNACVKFDITTYLGKTAWFKIDFVRNTYLGKTSWTRIDFVRKSGPHQARAPTTKETQVNPSEDSMKLLLKIDVRHSPTVMRDHWRRLPIKPNSIIDKEPSGTVRPVLNPKICLNTI